MLNRFAGDWHLTGPVPAATRGAGGTLDANAMDDGAGHRRQVEMYGDGSLHFRNEVTHLCPVPSAREPAYVTIANRSDDATHGSAGRPCRSGASVAGLPLIAPAAPSPSRGETPWR